MIYPLFIILSTVAALSDPFAPGEMGPAMLIVQENNTAAQTDYTQTLQLHKGWNLVSWHIEPLPQPFTMQDILPNPSWFTDAGGQLFKWNDRNNYWPDFMSPTEVWNLHYAYYMWLDSPHNWNEFPNRPLWTHGPVSMQPSGAWTYDPAVGDEQVRWFFLGYSTPGYMKLASIPNTEQVASGNPTFFDYEGPLHWLIWHQDPDNNYPIWDLKIIKTDDGKCYVPTPAAPHRPYDNIGVLEPGRGYFLGFYCPAGRTYTFAGWPDNPTWTNNAIEPQQKGENAQISSATHFQFTPLTHWFYPILVDTVDLEQTPLEVGDEISVFDGGMCVGSVQYQGSFPLQLNAWEDDIATPDILDGYLTGQPMTFKWYDVSANTEAEFVLPPGTQAVADDPVAPTHSGFGAGFYAVRSFTDGVQSVQQFPQAFHVGQSYPNPFNSETILPLDLPQRSLVRVELFNVRGQNLGLVYEGVQNAGWPKLHLRGTTLASGLYFCSVTAEGLERKGRFEGINKMLLLK